METTSETKILNVGDVIYESGNYGLVKRLTVESVTPRRATLSNGYVVKRELKDCGYWRAARIGAPTWEIGLRNYKLENESLKREWLRQESLEKLKGFNYSNCTDEQLAAILTIIETQPTPP